MKSLLLFLLMFTTVVSVAQNVEVPEKEFTIALPDETLTIARSETKTIEIRIQKSRSYQKGKTKWGLSSALPAGVTMLFNEEKVNADFAQASISVSPEAVPGLYSVIVNATVNYKTKGAILKIFIQ